jgi:hypothetical protein
VTAGFVGTHLRNDEAVFHCCFRYTRSRVGDRSSIFRDSDKGVNAFPGNSTDTNEIDQAAYSWFSNAESHSTLM